MLGAWCIWVKDSLMKLNKITVTLIAIWGIVSLWGCMIVVAPFTIFGAADSFYRHGDDPFDVDLNFPLIKPYYASAVPEGFPHNKNFNKYVWRINLEGGGNSKVGWYFSICCDIKIAVENNLIFVYAPNQEPFSPVLNQEIYYWFVLNPSKVEELGFVHQAEFNEYLKTNHLDEPKWQEPNSLHDEFNMTGCLDWYPNCRKIPPIFRFPPSLFETY